MATINVLGMDYGASNGRGMIGRFDGDRLSIEEIHRFPNSPVTVLSSFYWDILSLFSELKKSIIKAKSQSIPVSTIGIDTWGIDFGITDAQGNLLGNPHHYRDNRTNDILKEAYEVFPEYEIFSKSGMHPLHICTLFQLLSMKKYESDILEKSKTMLFTPNLLNYFLTGNVNCESTMASSSLLYSPFTNNWIGEFLNRYELPEILPAVNKPGYIIGNILESVREETGAGNIKVVSVAQHDTASAIAAVPAENKQEVVYISCGTWSVVGTAIGRPIVNEAVLKNRFNNEIGYDNEIMFVKNITGLWVLQECVREWEIEGYKIDYSYMNEYAEKSGFASSIDVDDESFALPGNMSRKVVEYCKRTGQKPPENREEIYKSIILGLALKYREVIGQTEVLTGKKFDRIHIIGGGSRNKLLCRLTAKETGMEVVAGPYEATVIGNIMAQLIALGEIKDMAEGIQVIKNSFALEEYK